jgi:hypothetical protein
MHARTLVVHSNKVHMFQREYCFAFRFSSGLLNYFPPLIGSFELCAQVVSLYLITQHAEGRTDFTPLSFLRRTKRLTQ